MKYSVYDIVRRTSAKTGFHIEHILSRNEESTSKFESEEEFNEQRNRLGGLLLLYGQDNISSGNETFVEKLKTYSNGLLWGKTLAEETYHANIRFREFDERFRERHNGLGFNPISDFTKNSLDYRGRLLFAISQDIWDVN